MLSPQEACEWIYNELDCVFEGIMVAGGAALKMILPDIESNDIDIFIYKNIDNKTKKWLSKNAEYVDHTDQFEELAKQGQIQREGSASDSEMPPSKENWIIPSKKIDLIFTGGGNFHRLIDSFDIGLVQVGWLYEEKHLIMSEAARLDIINQTITSMRRNPTENQKNRLRKYQKRTGWDIIYHD